MMIIDETFAKFLDVSPAKLHTHCRMAQPGDKDDSDADYSQKGQCLDDYIPKDFDCLRSLITTYEENCQKLTDYDRKFVKYFVRECEQPRMPLDQLKEKLADACN